MTSRVPSAPVDAATLVLLRDASDGLEVFCVERNRNSRFMGGALVFPGGKVDPEDRDPAWRPLLRAPDPRVPGDEEMRWALALAACRESLEEAAILPITGTLSHDEAVALRDVLAGGAAGLREALLGRGLIIDLGALVPFGRWITPAAEARRFDARFFMLRTPAGQDGVHDDQETMSSVWAAPAAILARWEAHEVQLAPPTHYTLQWLSAHGTVQAALSAAQQMPMDPICPVLVDYDGTLALTLPGDPEHPQRDRITDGRSRYVLRDEQWRPEELIFP
jgi:8-oxo-dGTP pyrophosphatase MutT (NUDIX family)